jgi:flagellar basal-body rod protein FlgB
MGDGLPALVNADRQRVGTQVANLGIRLLKEAQMDPVLGVHAYALTLRAQRSEVLAANMANADTPGFKARDFDFAETLGRVRGNAMMLKTSRPQHVGGVLQRATESLGYRNPYQPSLDGNTVEAEEEMARFSENAVGYQASLMFVTGRIRGLRAAITGAQ